MCDGLNENSIVNSCDASRQYENTSSVKLSVLSREIKKTVDG